TAAKPVAARPDPGRSPRMSQNGLPLTPPVAPMLARLARELPLDGYVYEPKWDGFRCLAFRDGGAVDLRSRNQRPLARYLPELVRDARPPLHLTAATGDAARARAWLARFQGAGIDGVVAKHEDLRYEPGRRAMVKVKPERTADCVVAGFRWFADRPLPSALLL